jgi:hypothetical protein
MRKEHVLAVALAISGLMVVPAAFAGKGNKGGGKHQAAPQMQTVASDVYSQYDKNYNGMLEDDEKTALRGDLASNSLLKAYDTDGDSKLSDAELASIPSTKQIETAAAAPAKKHAGKKKK